MSLFAGPGPPQSMARLPFYSRSSTHTHKQEVARYCGVAPRAPSGTQGSLWQGTYSFLGRTCSLSTWAAGVQVNLVSSQTHL